MSSEYGTDPIRDEQIFLSRLADVSPVVESVEQVHVAAAVAAVREVTAAPSRRTALRPTAPLWRTPRMTISRIAAIVAGLSLPAKAFAATAVAAAAVGGAAVASAPEDPPADTPAAEALENAEENTGFELPARGAPDRGEELEATVEDDDVEAQDDHENNGLDDDVRAVDPQERSEVGKARAAENRAAAEERAAEEAEARADAEARAAAEERRSQARDNAAAEDDGDVEVETEADDETDETEDQSSTGTERSGEGRARAGGASGR